MCVVVVVVVVVIVVDVVEARSVLISSCCKSQFAKHTQLAAEKMTNNVMKMLFCGF